MELGIGVLKGPHLGPHVKFPVGMGAWSVLRCGKRWVGDRNTGWCIGAALSWPSARIRAQTNTRGLRGSDLSNAPPCVHFALKTIKEHI